MNQGKDYADCVEIAVRGGGTPWDGWSDDEILELYVVGFDGWEPEAVRDSLARLSGETFQLRETRSHTSWGADGVAIQILLDVGIAVASAALWEGLRATGRRILAGSADAGEPAPQLTDEEAIDTAKSSVQRRYGVAPNDLALVSVEVAADSKEASVELQNDGTRYRVHFERSDGWLVLSRLRRSVMSGDATLDQSSPQMPPSA